MSKCDEWESTAAEIRSLFVASLTSDDSPRGQEAPGEARIASITTDRFFLECCPEQTDIRRSKQAFTPQGFDIDNKEIDCESTETIRIQYYTMISISRSSRRLLDNIQMILFPAEGERSENMFLYATFLLSNVYPGQCMNEVVRNTTAAVAAAAPILELVERHDSAHEPDNASCSLLVPLRLAGCEGVG